MLLSTTVIVATSANKTTVYSAYVTDEEQNVQYQQVSSMRSSLGDDGMDYVIANTMSTPMLVNDWREPHRTMLVIALLRNHSITQKQKLFMSLLLREVAR